MQLKTKHMSHNQTVTLCFSVTDEYDFIR